MYSARAEGRRHIYIGVVHAYMPDICIYSSGAHIYIAHAQRAGDKYIVEGHIYATPV